ncbi:S49 family peptidase [Luteococcus peritonei]|uniref:S49 family peptidase n=1 Tax=Luteococcus peritonei TaxID=88874 RepID=A0ABW4RW31_9ACTN
MNDEQQHPSDPVRDEARRPVQPAQQDRPAGATAAPHPAPAPYPVTPAQGVANPQQPFYQPGPPSQGWFRKGFGLGAGGALGAGLVLAGVTLATGFASMMMLAGIGAAMGDPGSSSMEMPLETVWGSENAGKTLRGIDVHGAIMAASSDGMGLTASTYGYEVADMIDQIDAEQADGLVLFMDTPGGTINGSRAIGDAVDRYQERTGKKVVAFVEGMSASGGMFAMAPVDKVIADHGTLVGSIGVISGPFQHYGEVVATDGGLLGGGVTTKGGITSEYLTQGKGKDFGNPYREMTAEERAVWTKGLANEYGEFVSWVSEHRKIPAATIRDDLGAHLYDAKTAKEKKLVDEVMNREDAMREAAKLNGLDPADTRVEKATTPGLLDSLLGADDSRVRGQAPAVSAKEGQPLVVTSVICSGAPQVLAWSGPTTSLCGK